MRYVWHTRPDGTKVVVGGVRKYVGETAKSMGAPVVWAAYPNSPLDHAHACTRWSDARDYVLSSYRTRERARSSSRA
jgi:hypothetical protein